MLLIKNIHVYAPEDLGLNDILVAGGKIERIEPNINISQDYVEIIDGSGKKALPGFIDPHVHITGGGGEGGSHTRAPEITLSTLVSAGITTVVGLLGTDGITRTPANLFSKAKALREEGVTSYALTGSYRYPTVTLMGDVQKDIVYVEECIGAKIAISDHRSSMVSDHELARLATDVRIAGMLAKKAGALTVHLGNGKAGLDPILRVLEQTDIPITTFRPTHVNRTMALLKQSFEFAKTGGYIDMTCGIYQDISASEIIRLAKEEEVPLDRITFSSDGGGSWSNYDELGKLKEIGISRVHPLYGAVKQMVLEGGYPLAEALPYITSHTAASLGLEDKGRLIEKADADLIMIDDQLKIESVMAKGKMYFENYCHVIKGTFE